MIPEILDRRVEFETPWFAVEAKDVRLPEPRGRETFWSIRTYDYAAVLAVTADRRVPLVRQYRPAIEQLSLELPSGLVEREETPEAAVRRELLEEACCEADALEQLACFHVDTGRMQTRQFAFFAPGARVVAEAPTGEEELEVVFVPSAELVELVRSGEFRMAGHVAIVAVALVKGRLAA